MNFLPNQQQIEFSQYDYAWEEGQFWNEIVSIFFRASSSPRKESSSVNSNRAAPATSFDDFQESVSDAWDLGDDEFCVISGNFHFQKRIRFFFYYIATSSVQM